MRNKDYRGRMGGWRMHLNVQREEGAGVLGRENGPYRSRDGIIFGVCRGLSDYYDVSLFWTRSLIVIGFIMTGFWPVGVAYILAALIMKPEPVLPLASTDEAEFYSSYANSRTMALQRLKRSFDGLDRRIQRMEAVVTGKEFEWERRLDEER